MSEPDGVAIVGIGAVFPGAGDAAAFWRNIQGGVDAITEVPAGRWDPAVYYDPDADGGDRFYCRRGGFVDGLADFDPARFGIMPAAVDGTEPDQLLALRAAAEAITDAGGDDRLPDRAKIGVFVGRGGYVTPGVARLGQRVRTAHQLTTVLADLLPGLPERRLTEIRAAFQDSLGPEPPGIGLVPNFAASRIANRFDFRGPAYTVDAACASSLIAVEHAVRELTAGRCDAVLAGAVHHCHDVTLWSVFSRLRALSPTERIRPFDRAADGTLISEGTGMLLLKRFADARRDGDRVYAVIRGVGVASDGRAASLMSPLVDGQVLAVERAWSEAGLDPGAPESLGLLEAHGTATPAGDRAELATLARVFGPPAGPEVTIGTVKSMIGHTMPASGIAGLIKAAFSVDEGVLPPTLNVEEPNPGLAKTRFTTAAEARPWAEGLPRRAAVNAFGFGGINAHVILEAPNDRRPGRHRRSRRAGEPILMLAAATPEELARLLAEPGPGSAEGPCRLAIVDPDPRKLTLAGKVVARGVPWRGRSDIWFTPEPLLDRPGRLAWLFPGFEPRFDPRIDDVARHFGLPAPKPHDGADLVEHAVDIVAVGRLLAAALSELGIVPDAMAGHSLGEWTAMIVGGIYERTAVDAFITSLRPGMVEVPDVVYAAVGCGTAQAEEHLARAGLRDAVVVSHDNCPHQTVICGNGDDIARAADVLQGHGVIAHTMPFRSGFHSPMIAPHLGSAHAALERLPVRAPEVPVWSATDRAPFPPDPAAVRDLVIRHLVEPVRFRELLERMYDSGVRAFVQVGPGSLTGFVEDTLRGRDHLVVPAAGRRDGMAQLRRVAAALWAEGMSPRLDRLTEAPSPTTVRLDLTTPLVRLTGSVPPLDLAEERAPAPRGERPGVVAEFEALLAETTAAAGAVVAAAAAEPAKKTTTRVFSLETMPAVADHCILPQPEDWPDDSDRFPVVPLTALLEVMADAALDLIAVGSGPAKHGAHPQPRRAVIGFERVRAARWLAVAPPATARIHAETAGHGRVKVTIEGYASGVVMLAPDGYPAAPPPRGRPLTAERPPPVDARRLYAENWMFHGPAFAGVAEIGAVADDGLRGALTVLPASGALLDSAGQLIGHWMQISVTENQTVFPVGIDAVRIYGPRPADGARLGCTVWIREVTGTGMRADAELRDAAGRVWASIEGWTTRRFATDDQTLRVKFTPDRKGVAEPQPGGWCLVRERWPDPASRELIMRRYLNAAERADYERLDPRAQRPWLLGRIAVKDAVRHRIWERGGPPIYPAEITVSNDEHGRPHVESRYGLHVSLAHTDRAGVAVATERPAGIDVEPVTTRGHGTLRISLNDSERHILDRFPAPARPEWFTRFWTAKEAVAKALGEGLAGRPKRFEVVSVDEAGELRVAVGGTTWRVDTHAVGDRPYVVAVTRTYEGD